MSIIIPAHNEEKVIEKCLNSLKGQDCKVILVNDGSNDKTVEVAKKTGVPDKIINLKKGHSFSFAFNQGAKTADTKYILISAADMIFLPDFIERVKSHLPFDCLSCKVLSHKPKTIFQRNWSVYRNYAEDKENLHPIFCLKKKIFEKVGGYNEKIFYYEDFDFKKRVLQLNNINYKPSDIIVYHIDTETFSDFIRQRKWQGKGIYSYGRLKNLKYFLPCFFPLLMAFQFLKYYPSNKKFKNVFFYILFDLFGRFISLIEFLKCFIK